jgi:hypothetical protein
MSTAKVATEFRRRLRHVEAKGESVEAKRIWRGLVEAAQTIDELSPAERTKLIADATPIPLAYICQEDAASLVNCPKAVVELLTALTWLADRYVQRAEREFD